MIIRLNVWVYLETKGSLREGKPEHGGVLKGPALKSDAKN